MNTPFFLRKGLKEIGSTNAKDIAILYMIFGIWSAMVGSSLSAIIRIELSGITIP